MPDTDVTPSFAGEIVVQDLPLDFIVPDKDQVRRTFDVEALEQLAASIREHRVIQPIVVRPPPPTDGEPSALRPYTIIAGERRWRASKIAGLQTIPAVIRADLVGQDVSVLQILENLQRQDLPLPETAAGVAKLVEQLGNAEAAKQLGKSEAWVSKHARIGGLPESIRMLVADGKIDSADIALELAKATELSPQHWQVEQALNSARCGELTREQVRRALDGAKANADFIAKQRSLLEDTNQSNQTRQETPEQAAARAEREREVAEREREREKEERLRERRIKQIETLKAEAAPEIKRWLEALEQRGLKLPRMEDTGELDTEAFDYLEEGENEAMIRPALYAYGQGPIPRALADVRFEIGLFLTWSQVQTAMAALLGDAPAPTASARADNVESFVKACIEFTKDAVKTKAADVHAAYLKWAAGRDGTPLAFNDNRWGEAIAAHGIEKVRSNGIRYVGVSLRR